MYTVPNCKHKVRILLLYKGIRGKSCYSKFLQITDRWL